MIARIFLPPLDTTWRLLADWKIPVALLNWYGNRQTLWAEEYNKQIDRWRKATGLTTSEPDWIAKMQAWEANERELRGTPEFLAGTVFSMERYHVSRSGENQITIKLLASPCPLLNPRKLGGKLSGPGRFYLTLADFNTFPPLEEANLP